jgi:hypothetical protein
MVNAVPMDSDYEPATIMSLGRHSPEADPLQGLYAAVEIQQRIV